MNSWNHLIKQENIDLGQKLRVLGVVTAHPGEVWQKWRVPSRRAADPVVLPFQISPSSLQRSKIFRNWQRTEVEDLVLALFQTTCFFTFRVDTSPNFQQHPTTVCIFSSKKLCLSETGCSTLWHPALMRVKWSHWNHNSLSSFEKGRYYQQHHASKRRRKIPSRVEQILKTAQHIDGYSETCL